jgi:hypothetical protein
MLSPHKVKNPESTQKSEIRNFQGSFRGRQDLTIQKKVFSHDFQFSQIKPISD